MIEDFYKNKKVLLTGHTGFKGSWLCMLLKHLGADIYGYALEPPTKPNLFELCKIDNIIHSTIGDIRDFKKLTETLKSIQPEIIIHMAAQAIVMESYKNPVETYDINVMGTIKLLEAIRSLSSVKAVVNVTTDKCYENKEWHWGYRENDHLGGYDPYSSSKACSEIVTAAYRRSFFQPPASSFQLPGIATARAGNVIGGGDWAADRLIPDFIRSIEKKEKIIIRSPNSIRPWQHVLEPLRGYLVLAEALYNAGDKYADAWNFGPNDEDAKNVEWIVKYLCESWGNGAAYTIDSKPQPHEATYLKLDCSKAKAVLNWHPRWSLRTALDNIVEFTKAYINKEDLEKICTNQIKNYLKD
jgi:CDP-glucose 4,6-dehydratase